MLGSMGGKPRSTSHTGSLANVLGAGIDGSWSALDDLLVRERRHAPDDLIATPETIPEELQALRTEYIAWCDEKWEGARVWGEVLYLHDKGHFSDVTTEPFHVLESPEGGALAFEVTWGFPMPKELAQLQDWAWNTDLDERLHDMSLKVEIWPRLSANENLFELVLDKAHDEPMGPGLLHVFAGVIAIASDSDGGTYLYPAVAASSLHFTVPPQSDLPVMQYYFASERRMVGEYLATSLPTMVYASLLAQGESTGELAQPDTDKLLAALEEKAQLSERFESESFSDLDYTESTPFHMTYSLRAEWLMIALSPDDEFDIEELVSRLKDWKQPGFDPSEVMKDDSPYKNPDPPFEIYNLWRAFFVGNKDFNTYMCDLYGQAPSRLTQDTIALLREFDNGRTALGRIKDLPARQREIAKLKLWG